MEPAAAPEADTLVAREAGGRRAGRSASSVRSPRGEGTAAEGCGPGGVRSRGVKGRICDLSQLDREGGEAGWGSAAVGAGVSP